MCMLTFLPADVQPNPEALLNGAETNNDGHGFAIVTREARNPIVRRYLDAEVAVAEFSIMRETYSDGPALFHSRWGTAGVYGLYNTHPFRVDRRTVLAHNGVLPWQFQPHTCRKACPMPCPERDNRCDTKLYAELLRGTDLSDPKMRNTIARDIGAANKFVILSTKPGYDSSYIINEESGHWVGETWYSNMDFVGWEWGKGRFTALPGTSGRSGEQCLYCRSTNLGWNGEFCDDCELCQDCGYEFFADCLCYVPSSMRQESGL